MVNYAIIGFCSVVFLAQLADQADGTAGLVERLGMIPKRVFHPGEAIVPTERVAFIDNYGRPVEIVRRQPELAAPPFTPWLTLLTCIFLHGGWMHFLGNMWFLFIFGDNVEDRIGHLGYMLFYLFSGVAASSVHLLSDPSSQLPTIGASGAIAGVMGAYSLLYPRAHVVAWFPIAFFFVLPAPVFLGVWFLLQFFHLELQTTGVAWWAHIGGFVIGFLVAAVLRGVGETRPPVERLRPKTERISVYRYRR